MESGIENGGGIDAAFLAADSGGSGQVVRPGFFQGMAGSAGNGIVRGKAHVMKKLVAQGNFGRIRGEGVRNGGKRGKGVFLSYHIAENFQALILDPLEHGVFLPESERAAPVHHGVGSGGHGIDLKHMFQLGKGDGSGRFFHIVAALPVPDMARQQASGKSIDQFGNVSAGLVAVRTFGIHGLCGNFRRLGGRQWLDILVRQEQGGDSRRHDDRAAQNGSCLDEGTCFAHEIFNDVELPGW